jgi:hypothetical protein
MSGAFKRIRDYTYLRAEESTGSALRESRGALIVEPGVHLEGEAYPEQLRARRKARDTLLRYHWIWYRMTGLSR